MHIPPRLFRRKKEKVLEESTERKGMPNVAEV